MIGHALHLMQESQAKNCNNLKNSTCKCFLTVSSGMVIILAVTPVLLVTLTKEAIVQSRPPAAPPHTNAVTWFGCWPIGGEGASDRYTLFAEN